MKKTVVFLMTLIIVVSACVGCTTEAEDHYDYKSGYERLYERVTELETVLDAIQSSANDELCVCLGDAITAAFESPDDYPSVIAAETGMNVINGSFSGQMSRHSSPEMDAFSMYRIADAIASGDWSMQENILNANTEVITSAHKRLEALKAVNWEEVDIITIAYGTSDIYAGVQIDGEDKLSVSTFLGALRYSIEKIQSAYPSIQILVITPIYRVWEAEGLDSDTKNINGHFTYEWVDGMINVAKLYKIPYLDLFRTSGFNKNTYEYYYVEAEGLSGAIPNAIGQELMGKKIAAALEGMY